jgi:hypothetical protein
VAVVVVRFGPEIARRASDLAPRSPPKPRDTYHTPAAVAAYLLCN